MTPQSVVSLLMISSKPGKKLMSGKKYTCNHPHVLPFCYLINEHNKTAVILANNFIKETFDLNQEILYIHSSYNLVKTPSH